ncbi:hypothetical protein BO99DRAFT_349004, partial [Aspergillus violaceofuscus CBS 115571]
AIWRSYKKIKKSRGWASLIFIGSGVYYFYKYRISFNNSLTTYLYYIISSLKVATDTLYPR